METLNSENRNQYALITGATSGIGYELARLFAQDGYNLILVARNKERLQEVTNELKTAYAVEVTPMVKDLFRPAAAKELYDDVKAMRITVNVLVNDAGQGQWGPFLETDLERDIDIIQLNIISLLSLTKYFVKDMVTRNEGRILQLGSEAGTTPMPLLSVYAATKAFVISFSAALSNELKDTGVTVTVLLPGATDTDFFHKAQQEDTVTYRENQLASPAEVARDGYDALMKGESKIISGAKTKMHVFMSDLLGTTGAAANARKLNEISNEEEGRTESTHTPSRKERETVWEQTGSRDGDYR
ncbi:MAG TPA: SDR family oxidoreductase [Chitinophaga sp.]|uniref:SDR family NAD(P)-dependent oxidoreductase n=1 Tax=Chitinophaga sp. TaxID=1869181 RepID=UPI002DBA1ADF|nr:SDR family oxidoreductase [Chitinophaga sp.]HEU4551942.1 SDR family oxidoreductase [Chitinophaga sp.]